MCLSTWIFDASILCPRVQISKRFKGNGYVQGLGSLNTHYYYNCYYFPSTVGAKINQSAVAGPAMTETGDLGIEEADWKD